MLADIAVRRYGLDFFVADAGAPYEQTKMLNGWNRYRRNPAANYVPLMAGLGTRGLSVFLADQATAADAG